jgi:integrase
VFLLKEVSAAKVFTQAGVEKLKATDKRQMIRDGGSTALFLVIQPKPSGYKSWAMRYRYGESAKKLHIGPLDISGRRHEGEPVIGQPLSLVQARQVASKYNSDRAAGVDVIAAHRARKHRRKVAIAEASANSFTASAKDFIVQHVRVKTREHKQTAAILGFDAELNVKPGGLAERWNARDVRTITDADLHAVVEEARRYSIPGMAARHDRASESRARKTHSVLSRLFGWLLRHRRIAVNPMTALHRPAAGPSRDRVLTAAEIRAFWVATETLTEPFGDALRMLLVTGCRLNEIARLRWEEVSDDCSIITIPGERTKNRRSFVIPVPPMARRLLADQDRNGEFVFSTTGGISPISSWSDVKRRLDAAMGSVSSWVIHDLRRTAATGMAEIGIQPHIIEAILNHLSGHKASVAGIYNRAQYASEKREALERWASHLENIVGDTKIVAIRGGRA